MSGSACSHKPIFIGSLCLLKEFIRTLLVLVTCHSSQVISHCLLRGFYYIYCFLVFSLAHQLP